MLRLRPYQERCIDALRSGFKEGHQSQILYMPTGAGKTESAIALLLATQSAGNNCAMVLDRRVLCDQTSKRLEKYSIDHGVLMSGHHRYRPNEKIQICSAQTLEARGSFPGLKLLIVDEAHTIRKETADFIKSTGIRAIGLSASPFTKGLGNIYSNVINGITTHDLVSEGSLVPLKVFVAKEIDMTGAKKVAGEWSQKEATERGIKITGDVVTEWTAKTFEIFGKPEKTIIFSAGVAHGNDLERKFNEAGYNFVSLSYKTNKQFCAEAIEEISKPDSSIHGLIATDMLTKGFDVPGIKIGISARPFTKSLSSHIQQMGRVMRPDYGKDFALWICHSGNYLRFKDEWEDVYVNGVSELDDGKEKPKKEPSKEEKEAAKCPKCSHIWPSNSDMCAHCGHVRQRKNEVIEKPGNLVELGYSLQNDADMKRSFYHQLYYIERERNYRPKWAMAMYHKKFGSWPRFDNIPETPTNEVLKYVKSRLIAFAKRRR